MKKSRATNEKIGLIFDIERFAIHDGPGIRTVVFFKGCNLECIWCSNPESISPETEFGYKKEYCEKCFSCINSCKNKNLIFKNDRIYAVNIKMCLECEDFCIRACPNNALIKFGKYYTVDELFEILIKDQKFYKNSGGGVTFSGGEAFMQADFLLSIMKKCRKEKINIAVETAGCFDYELFKKVNPFVDYYLYDLKTLDSTNHLTGVNKDNKKIIQNLLHLDKDSKKILLRIPLIPGFNDSKKELTDIFEFFKNLKNIVSIHFLPFHKLGCPKYKWINRSYQCKYTCYSKNGLIKKIDEINQMNKKYDFKVIFGGLQ